MAKERVVINLTFSADLDQVPGWGHVPLDWVSLVRTSLERNSHYNARVDIKLVEIENPAPWRVEKTA